MANEVARRMDLHGKRDAARDQSFIEQGFRYFASGTTKSIGK
jgi:hypothetical protein